MIDFDAIRQAVDLREECERSGVVFSRAGLDWVGLCPFHQERTPSFTLHGAGAVHFLSQYWSMALNTRVGSYLGLHLEW